MDEASQGLIMFGIIAIGSGVVWHAFIKRFWIATTGSALTAPVLFQVVAYLNLGYLDPLFVIALMTTAVVAFVIGVLVGLPFKV